MKAIEAVRKLSSLGYRFELAGDRLRYRYEGPGEPYPAQVRPLLDTVKAHKPEEDFLKSCCPRCGGAATTCPDYEVQPLCLACDWMELVKLYPAILSIKL